MNNPNEEFLFNVLNRNEMFQDGYTYGYNTGYNEASRKVESRILSARSEGFLEGEAFTQRQAQKERDEWMDAYAQAVIDLRKAVREVPTELDAGFTAEYIDPEYKQGWKDAMETVYKALGIHPEPALQIEAHK